MGAPPTSPAALNKSVWSKKRLLWVIGLVIYSDDMAKDRNFIPQSHRMGTLPTPIIFNTLTKKYAEFLIKENHLELQNVKQWIASVQIQPDAL